jgi:uncharacterized protein
LTKPKALIVWGGWDGHQPKQVAELLEHQLTENGFEVEVSDTLDAFLEGEKLLNLSVIVPIWSMGKISRDQLNLIADAVKSGVGIAGVHGGMCDSFREETEWQFMTGGQFVSHPGNDGTNYTVRTTQPDHYIMAGAPAEFAVSTEHYYMHVDPAIQVLATTKFPVADGPHVPNGEFDMPVVWTKHYGKGKVFYNSLGHHADIIAQPEVLRLTTRGLLWAANREDLAKD